MDAEKRKRYEAIAAEVVRLAGGRDNILGVAHCATRLRLVLEDNDLADLKAIEDVDLAKGVFVAGFCSFTCCSIISFCFKISCSLSSNFSINVVCIVSSLYLIGYSSFRFFLIIIPYLPSAIF